jgi:hypothetical protein
LALHRLQAFLAATVKGEYAMPDRMADIPLNTYPARGFILEGAPKGALADLRLVVLLTH